MTILYKCPSVKSNKTIACDSIDEIDYRIKLCSGWFASVHFAIEANRVKRNKLIAKKAREIQKLSEVY